MSLFLIRLYNGMLLIYRLNQLDPMLLILLSLYSFHVFTVLSSVLLYQHNHGHVQSLIKLRRLSLIH